MRTIESATPGGVVFRPRERTVAGFALTAIFALVACRPDAATGVSATPPRALGLDVAAADAALYDQDPPTVGGLFSIVVPARLADDFVVPAGQVWRATGIRVGGSTDFTPVFSDFSMELVIRTDHGGLPGDALGTFPLTPTSSIHDATFANADHFVFELPTDVHLAAGKYWLEFNQNKRILAWNDSPLVGSGPVVWNNGAWAPFFVFTGEVDIAFAILGVQETPVSLTANLRTSVAGFGLDKGIANSFDVKLTAALAAISANDKAGACSAMQDFMSHAAALSGKKMTAAQATTLIDEATLVRTTLGC